LPIGETGIKAMSRLQGNFCELNRNEIHQPMLKLLLFHFMLNQKQANEPNL